MPIYITKLTHEAYVFLGTLASMEALGAKFLSVRERTTVAGALGDPVTSYVGPDGRTIEAGAVYVREVEEIAPGQLGTPGPWVYFGQVWSPEVQQLNAVLLNRQVKAVAGNPMRNPLGLPIVLPDGTRPTQPATGEPARDPWTGVETGETEP